MSKRESLPLCTQFRSTARLAVDGAAYLVPNSAESMYILAMLDLVMVHGHFSPTANLVHFGVISGESRWISLRSNDNGDEYYTGRKEFGPGSGMSQHWITEC